jgi:hypothetical protein
MPTYKTLEDVCLRPSGTEHVVKEFGDALAVAAALKNSRVDWRAHASRIEFDGTRFVFTGRNSRIRGAVPTSARVERKAIQQLPSLLNVSSMNSAFLLNNDPEAAAWNITHFLSKTDKILTVRGWDDGSDVSIRAFGGERYNPGLDTYEVLQAMASAKLGGHRGQRVFPDEMPVIGRVGRDRASIRIPLDITKEIHDLRDGGRSVYQAGVILRNGEVKNGRLRIDPYVMRTACENSIYVPDWNESMGVGFNHAGSMTAYNAVAQAVNVIATLLTKDTDEEYSAVEMMMNQLADAAMHEMDDNGVLAAVAQFTNAFKLNDEAKMTIAQKTVPYAPGRLAVVNALTDWANELDTSLAQDTVRTAAGDYLFTGKFTLPGEKERDGEDLADLLPAELLRATK